MSNYGLLRTVACAALSVCCAVALTACGDPQPSPLQSPQQPTATISITPPTSPPVAPTVGAPPIAPTTATPLFVPTVIRTPAFLPTPFGTPDTQGTSQAVVVTLTALAAVPTNPSGQARSPNARPIGAGPGDNVPRATPTPTLDPTGISLLSVSDKVYAGGAVALTIRTQPNAVCVLQIARTQSDGVVKTEPAPGGASRQAGDDGVVAWIWQVNANEPPGQATLIVNCGPAGATQFQIEVTR